MSFLWDNAALRFAQSFVHGPEYSSAVQTIHEAGRLKLPALSMPSDLFARVTAGVQLPPTASPTPFTAGLASPYVSTSLNESVIDAIAAARIPSRVFLTTENLIPPNMLRAVNDLIRSTALAYHYDLPSHLLDTTGVEHALSQAVWPNGSFRDLIEDYTGALRGADIGVLADVAVDHARLWSGLGLTANGILARVDVSGVRFDLPRPAVLDQLRTILDTPAFRPGGLVDSLIDEMLADERTAEDVEEATDRLFEETGSVFAHEQLRRFVVGLLSLLLMGGWVQLSSPSSLGDELLSIEFMQWVLGAVGSIGTARWMVGKAEQHLGDGSGTPTP